MFRFYVVISFILFFFIAGLMIYRFSFQGPLGYSVEGQESSSFSSNAPKKFQQERFGLQKDIYVTKKGKRFRIRGLSAHSKMTVEPEGKGNDVREALENADFLIENGIRKGKNWWTHIQANEWNYDFSHRILVAKEVSYERFTADKDLFSTSFSALQPEISIKAKSMFGKRKGKKNCLEAMEIAGKLLFLQDHEIISFNASKGFLEDPFITLNGDAYITCSHAKLRADEIQLEKDSSGIFSKIKANGNVKITTDEGANLLAENALIDANQAQALFTAEQDFVLYREEGKPFTWRCKLINIFFEKGSESEFSIQNVQAEKDITITLENGFVAHSDYAFIEKRGNSKEQELTLSKTEGGRCEILNDQGDRIFAEKIFIYRPSGTIVFQKANGILKDIAFQTNTLFFDPNKNRITLEGEAYLVKDEAMQLHSQKIDILRNKKNEKEEILQIQSHGLSNIVFADKKKENTSTVVCYGAILIDNEIGKAELSSPKNNGIVEQGKQICLEDARGKIFADSIEILYEKRHEKFKPVKFTLEGDVHLVNCPENVENGLQYVLAEKAEYFPDKSNEMILYGSRKNRVLFYAEQNQLQVSAESLRLWRDGKTSKESIQGIGDVRFTFVSNEFSQLTKHFNFDNIIKK